MSDYQKGSPISLIQEKGLPYLIERIDIRSIRETTESSTREFCKYQNYQSIRNELVQEAEAQKKIRPQKKIVIVSR